MEGRDDGRGQARRWKAWVWSAEEEVVICGSVARGVNRRAGQSWWELQQSEHAAGNGGWSEHTAGNGGGGTQLYGGTQLATHSKGNMQVRMGESWREVEAGWKE